MTPNPFLGVFFHWLGGLASGSFYVPYKGVKKWSWETYWLVGGFFSWIIMPWLMANILTNDLLGVLKNTPNSTLMWAYIFGAMWGFGGLTFGLTMRYLGMSLGMGVALGYCAAFGTLVPPMFFGQFGEIISTKPGMLTLGGVVICLLGIFIAAMAGFTKEKEMPEAEKKKAIAEFSFTKGILVATFSGIMSACFAFGLAAGDPIKHLSLKANYIAGAQKAGKNITDVAPLDGKQTEDLIAALKGTEFFASATKEVQAKPSLPAVVEIIEQPIVLKASLENLKKDPTKAAEAATMEKKLLALEGSAVKELALLKQSTLPIAQRLIKYGDDLAKLAGKNGALQTIQSLKHLTVKEVAVATVLSGADYLAIHSKYQLWQGLPVLCVVLLGGFTTNFLWCLMLNLKNGTGYQYFSGTVKPQHASHGGSGGSEHGEAAAAAAAKVAYTAEQLAVPMTKNYLFSALAGTTWYMQFFFYTMGETQMGKFGFASWTLHMASIIIFSTMWGWYFHEWKGSSKKAHSLIATGIITLILSTIVIGAATYWKGLLAAQ
jgi:hypothetical protein